MPQNMSASALPTGPSQAEPEGVSALRASVPCAADESEWIEWRGGHCPVPADTRVDVRWNNRAVSLHALAGIYGGDPDLWSGPQNGGYIIAYRASSSREPQVTTTRANVSLPVEVTAEEGKLMRLTSPAMPRLLLMGRSEKELIREAPLVIAALVNEAQGTPRPSPD